jgi:hypothetical protein
LIESDLDRKYAGSTDTAFMHAAFDRLRSFALLFPPMAVALIWLVATLAEGRSDASAPAPLSAPERVETQVLPG